MTVPQALTYWFTLSLSPGSKVRKTVVVHRESHGFSVTEPVLGTGSMSQVRHSLRCHRPEQREHDALLLSSHHLGDFQGSPLSPFGLPYPAARQLLHNRPFVVVVWVLSFGFCCFVLWTPGSLWLSVLVVQFSLTV